MIERSLFNIAFSKQWGRQMRFITGPRQSGKTTLARQKLKRVGHQNLYYLWDLREVRRRYKENQLFFTSDSPPRKEKAWVCFDEIHKIPKWKNVVKAIFDSTEDHYHFIVTGSAKLDVFRRAGDSLAGRYFAFHLFPLSLSELNDKKGGPLFIPTTAKEWILAQCDKKTSSPSHFNTLLHYGGFPEPFLQQSDLFLSKWSDDYLDTVIKEDIGSLTRIIDNEHLFDLYQLLPAFVGSPLSDSSLASHLEISQPTIKSYLKRLDDFYLAFKISPYSKNIKRALLKASKCYLYDWTRIKDPGHRFENYVAVELKTKLSLWKESSTDTFDLFYIRNKSKEETDFLIVKNNKPWLLIEAKVSDGPIPRQHFQMQSALKGIPLVQLCQENGICAMEQKEAFRLSASRFFG